MNKPLLFLLGWLCCTALLNGQTVSGVVVDEAGNPIGQVLVKAKHPTMSLVLLAQAFTNDDGTFEIPCGQWDKCVIMVESAFYQLDKPINAQCGDVLQIPLTYQSQDITGVIVRGEAIPIIDKGDTILYNVAQLKQATDLTLEDMLRRLPDVKIDDGGQVTFRGRKIDRILVNGESIALDHTLLTRTITPEMLSKMEIRTKEDNTKLKQNLLDNAALLVLDLVLDTKVKESLFGQASLDAGHQDGRYRPNLHGSAFTLRPKLKGLLFVNWDHFGKRVISGEQLRELDADAFDAIFNLPANPDLLKKREVFHGDVFGFDDYFRQEPRIVGASASIDPLPKWNIKTGVFLSTNRVHRASTESVSTIGEALEAVEWRFTQAQTQTDLKSRIVSTYKINAHNWFTAKAFFKTVSLVDRSDMRYSSSAPYRYNDDLSGHQLALDAKYEHANPNDWRFHLRYHFVRQDDAGNNSLRFSDANYAGLFFATLPASGMPWSVAQSYGYAFISQAANALVSKVWGDLTVSVSSTWTHNAMSVFSRSESPDALLREDQLWAGDNTFQYARHHPKARVQYMGGRVRLGMEAGLDQILLDGQSWRRIGNFTTFSGNVAIDITNFEDLNVQYQESPADITNSNIGIGLLLTGVNGWILPADQLVLADPQRNASFSLSSKRLRESTGLGLELAGIYGRINNANALRLALDNPIWQEAFLDVQTSAYAMGGLFADWRAKRNPTTFAKLQSLLFNTRRDNIEGRTVVNRVFIHSLELGSNFKKRPWDVSGEIFLRTFLTDPSIGEFVVQQQTVSSKITFTGKLFNKRLLPQLTYRGIEQTLGGWEPLRTVDFNLRYVHNDKLSFHLEGYNLLNQTRQTKVEVNPLFYAQSSVALFDRFFRVGARYVFL